MPNCKNCLSFGCLESALFHTETVGSLSNSGETKSRAVYHDILVEVKKKKKKDNLSPPMTPLQGIHTGWKRSCIMHLEAAHVLSADHGNHGFVFSLKYPVEKKS